MTDWPKYETTEQQQARIAAQTPSAPMAPVRVAPALPTWAGVTLAITVGLLAAMSVVAVTAATTAIQARDEIAVLRGEIATMHQELDTANTLVAAADMRLNNLETDVLKMRSGQAELKEKLLEAQQQAQQQQQSGGFLDFLGLILPFLGF